VLQFSLPQLAAGPASQTGFQLVTFKENYHVIGVAVSEASGITNLGQLALTLQDEAQLSVFLNSQGQPGSVDLWALASVGGGLQKVGSYFPLDRYVETNKTWQANVSNANFNQITYPQVYLLVESWDPKLDPVAPRTGGY
jgi:hypothetical protein